VRQRADALRLEVEIGNRAGAQILPMVLDQIELPVQIAERIRPPDVDRRRRLVARVLDHRLESHARADRERQKRMMVHGDAAVGEVRRRQREEGRSGDADRLASKQQSGHVVGEQDVQDGGQRRWQAHRRFRERQDFHGRRDRVHDDRLVPHPRVVHAGQLEVGRDEPAVQIAARRCDGVRGQRGEHFVGGEVGRRLPQPR